MGLQAQQRCLQRDEAVPGSQGKKGSCTGSTDSCHSQNSLLPSIRHRPTTLAKSTAPPASICISHKELGAISYAALLEDAQKVWVPLQRFRLVG